MVRLIPGLAAVAAVSNIIGAVSLPDPKNNIALNYLEEHGASAPRSTDVVPPDHNLERRKGGGGRGGGSSSGGSSGGGSRSSGGSGGGSRTLGTSNAGGSTSAGSGPSRSFGRGGYYAGGAAVPYTAGQTTRRGIGAGPLLVGGAALALMPGLWLYSVYPYYYHTPYRFYNRTANATENNNNNNDARSIIVRQSGGQQGANETLPVVCLCQEYSVCGCEENTDQAYLDDLIGNGSYAALNKSLITVSRNESGKMLVLNGTLPNGTTAPGGVDDAASGLSIGRYAGYWAVGLGVLYGVML